MANDKFGIPMLKPTKSGGQTWFMNNDNFSGDSRVYGGEGFSIQSTYTVSKSSEYRAQISTSSGYDDGKCTQNQQTMVNRGYMQAANDWKNVEFTGEFRVFNAASDHITIGFRGARHTGSGGPRGCTGSNYKVSVAMNGSGVEIRKESWHVSYHDMEETNVSGFDSRDGPFKLKVLCYNVNDNKAVRVEVYIDKDNNNNFVKIIDDTDTGNVNSDADECNCNDDGQPLIWGSPAILIRGDAGKYGFKNMSIREIDPTGTGGGGSDGGGGSGGGSTPTGGGGYSISGITASGDDGNVPNNVRDANFDTRWSSFGRGQWIRLDMGSVKKLDRVKIAWYQGDQRTNNYDISTSDNGSSWTSRRTGSSSGNSSNLEDYNISPDVNCRYVRVTVNGNSNNDWASILEIELWGPDTATDGGGGGSTPPPPPPPTTADYNVIDTIFNIDYKDVNLCNPVGG